MVKTREGSVVLFERARVRGIWPVALIVVAVAAMFAGIFWLDRPISLWAHEQGVDMAMRKKATWEFAISKVMKAPGEAYYAVVVAVVVALVHQRRGWAGALVGLGAIASSSNTVGKWVSGRLRPFRDPTYYGDPWTWEPFRNGFRGIYEQTNFSFPSGHSCQAFAVATAIWVLYPRWGWVAFPVAGLTAAERVLTNSHFFSEVIAGGLLGAAGTLAVRWVLGRVFSKSVAPRGVPAGD